LEHMIEGQVLISKVFGKQITFCHNPTAMAHEEDMRGYLTDLTQAGTQLLGRITEEVDTLVQHLQESVQAVGKRGCVVHIAHSQGALITALASKLLRQEEMQRIEVITFGGAAAIRKTPETPFKRCINYYAVNDPLLMVVPSAAAALRSGLVDGDDEFCFLAPRGGDPLVDHNLAGPTYAQALQWEGQRFAQQYTSPVYRASRWLLLLIAAVVDGVMQQLRTAVKRLLRPLLFLCLLAYRITKLLALLLQIFVKKRVVQPALVLIWFVWEWIQTNIRGERKYQPVSKIPNES